MKKQFQCPCGQTDQLQYYKNRSYECKACHKLRVKNNKVAPKCKCGETDPANFCASTPYTCKACQKQYASARYQDPEYRSAKIAYNLVYQKANVFQYRWLSAKKRAGMKGIPFEITVADIETLYNEQGGVCFYSGIPFDIDSKHYTCSIDRINSAKGYTKDNVVLACNIVNSMKLDLSLKEFQTVVEAVHATLSG